MSAKVTIEEAKEHLAELISQLAPGEEVIIFQNDQPIAKLTAEIHERWGPRQPGSARGKLFILSDDDEHLDDFEEYIR